MATAHSLFGASSAKRLINCPGGYRLTEALAKLGQGSGKSSIWAAEGTAAHYIAEQHLMGKTPATDWIGKSLKFDGYDIPVDSAFIDNVMIYVDYVETLKALGYEIYLEEQVQLDELFERFSGQKPATPLFGTADCVAVHTALGHVAVVDLKFGAGVPVDVKGNDQVRYYATGAVDLLGRKPPASAMSQGMMAISSFDLVIIQPRAPHPDGPVRKETIMSGELLDWFQNTLIPAVLLATTTPDAPLKSGKHCQFCPVSPACPELHTSAQDKARAAFDDQDLPKGAAPACVVQMGPDERGEYLRTLDVLEDHIARTREHFHQIMLDDPALVAGHKLVAKRATRKWKDPEQVFELIAKNVTPADAKGFIDIEPKSPAQMQGLPLVKANKTLAKLFKDLEFSVSSGTTIAPEEDPRPAVAARPAAKDAFSDEATED